MNTEELKLEVSKLNYKDVGFDVEDFRDLSLQDRKIFIQRFIDILLYDTDKFKAARRLLLKWETLNQIDNGKDGN